MLGLKRGTVKLTSHHKQWAKLFEKEKNILLLTLGDIKTNIEHVGSTAIPGVLAKPIIDMMLGISKSEQTEMIYKKLQELGYEDRGEQGIPGQRLFVRGPEENRTHYLHITKLNSDFWQEHILFRDYLKQNKEARDEYNQLKKNLAEKYSDKRELYTKAKADFIQNIIDKAKHADKTRKK